MPILPIFVFLQIYFFAHPNDFYSFENLRAARNDSLFFIAVFYPDLTIETIAVPAEIAVGNIFDREILKTSEKRIVFGNFRGFAENFYFDKAVERFENVFKVV